MYGCAEMKRHSGALGHSVPHNGELPLVVLAESASFALLNVLVLEFGKLGDLGWGEGDDWSSRTLFRGKGDS